jgi:hypothetical protein
MSIKIKYEDYQDCDSDGEPTTKEIDGVELELGKVYSQASSSWSEKHYLIIFIDDKVAVGRSIYNQISNKYIGDYEIFNKNNGMKYQDGRLAYRIKKLKSK